MMDRINSVIANSTYGAFSVSSKEDLALMEDMKREAERVWKLQNRKEFLLSIKGKDMKKI